MRTYPSGALRRRPDGMNRLPETNPKFKQSPGPRETRSVRAGLRSGSRSGASLRLGMARREAPGLLIAEGCGRRPGGGTGRFHGTPTPVGTGRRGLRPSWDGAVGDLGILLPRRRRFHGSGRGDPSSERDEAPARLGWPGRGFRTSSRQGLRRGAQAAPVERTPARLGWPCGGSAFWARERAPVVSRGSYSEDAPSATARAWSLRRSVM